MRRRRDGFTLIEMMVVISIISLLAALTAGAVMRYLSTQNGNNTETTITRLNSELRKAWQKVIDDAQREEIPSAINTAYGCNGDVALQRVIYTKMRLMQEFPMSFDEVLSPFTGSGPWVLPPDPGYVRYLQQYRITGSGLNSRYYESSACLMMALQKSRSGMSLNAGLLTLSKREFDDVPYLADGWGQPLAFYRWPTASDEVDRLGSKTGPASIKRDPQDPEGKLMDPSWWGGPGWQVFCTNIHALPKTASPASRFALPVIVSAGANKRLGIDIWPTQVPDPMSIGNNTGGLAIFSAPVSVGTQDDANDNLSNIPQ